MAIVAGTEVEQLPGLRYPLKRLSTGFVVQEVDWRDDPDHDEEWADQESVKYGGRRSVYWRMNYEREVIRGGEPIWPCLARQFHVRPFPPQELRTAQWAVYRTLDHGLRHPTCCAFVAVNKRGDLHFFDQYYATGATIAVNCKAISEQTPPELCVQMNVADPAIWTRDPKTLETYADEYARNGMPLVKADNSRLGYDTMSACFLSSVARWCLGRRDFEALRDVLNWSSPPSIGTAERLAQHPAIWFDPKCANGRMSLFEQCLNLRWRELAGDQTHRAAPQEPEDVDDEGADVVRYAAQSASVQWRLPRPSDDRRAKVLKRLLEWEPAPKSSRNPFVS
jgi:hypothetical protein